jgi:hypothetical protein
MRTKMSTPMDGAPFVSMNIPPSEMSLPLPENVSRESLVVNSMGKSIRDRPKRRCSSELGDESRIDSPSARIVASARCYTWPFGGGDVCAVPAAKVRSTPTKWTVDFADPMRLFERLRGVQCRQVVGCSADVRAVVRVEEQDGPASGIVLRNSGAAIGCVCGAIHFDPVPSGHEASARVAEANVPYGVCGHGSTARANDQEPHVEDPLPTKPPPPASSTRGSQRNVPPNIISPQTIVAVGGVVQQRNTASREKRITPQMRPPTAVWAESAIEDHSWG